MEFDSQLLQDLLEFLRTLEGVKLPAKFEALRGKLLDRMRTALSGHYMDMEHGKPLKDRYVVDNSSEEYVIPDQQPLSPRSFLHQHQIKKVDNIETKQAASAPSRPPTYLPLQPEEPSARRFLLPPIAATVENAQIVKDVDTANPVLEVYSTMSWAKATAKSHFFGQLQRREKWFLFENIRPFWAALVGAQLLSYDNKTDPRPSQVLSIVGCRCRPVAALQRNVKKLSDSTFELHYENYKSFQFIASTPKEMEQWIAMIVRWEAKSRDTNNAHSSPSIPFTAPAYVSEDEASSDESTPTEEYIDIVIDNIAEALATPAKALKQSPSISLVVQPAKPKVGLKPKLDAPKISDLDKSLRNRVLPPPPLATQNSKSEEEVYQIIEESDHNEPSTIIKPSSSVKDLQDDNGELYDDIETVKNEVKQIIQANNNKREMEEKISVQESAADDMETYDDVDVVKREVEEIKKRENATKKSAEVEKEKKSPKEVSAVAIKSSPMKNFFDRFRQKSESPQKEGAKKKTNISTPQQPVKISNSKELPIGQNSSETTDGRLDDQPPEELSDYNSLPRPRPVQQDKSLAKEIEEEEEDEAIYDDVTNRKEGSNNPIVGTERVLEKRKMNDNSATRYAGPTINMAQRNVVRNLNEKFRAEIYQNQTGDSQVEDDLEHYQVPRSDTNIPTQIPLEDDDAEKIYDDVEIVAQKRRENEQAKPKPPVATPLKHSRGPPVLARPLEKNFLNKLNKFTLSAAEKNISEKTIQHRFNTGKKPKGQEAIIPLKKHQITPPADEEIYDDCQAKG